MRALQKSTTSFRLLRCALRPFSERLDEMEERKKQRLTKNLKSTEAPQYWVTSARPANFGDHLQIPTKPDNWFDENRIWNEEDKDYRTRRAKMYAFDAFIYGFWVTVVAIALKWGYGKLVSKNWKIVDTYEEFDITTLEPGKTVLITYLGKPIFIRLLTYEDVKTTFDLEDSTQWDKKSYVATTDKDDKQLLVVYAETIHGTIPEPLKGPYGGWYCPITGQVFDKFGRIRKDGKKGKNLQYVNHVLHGNVLCLEKKISYKSNYSHYYI